MEAETGKMFAFLNRILDWFKSLFWKEEMELTLVGLQYSGKTTFVNVIAVCVSAVLRMVFLHLWLALTVSGTHYVCACRHIRAI